MKIEWNLSTGCLEGYNKTVNITWVMAEDANHALYYHDEVRHIEEMKKLYDELPEIPEWLPPEKLKEYEEQLLGYKEEAKLPTEDIENVNEKQQKASSGEYVSRIPLR